MWSRGKIVRNLREPFLGYACISWERKGYLPYNFAPVSGNILMYQKKSHPEKPGMTHVF